MPIEKINITNSIHEVQKIEVAKMYYHAFIKKFSSLWLFAKNEAQAVTVLRQSLRYENGLYVLSNNRVLGFVGLEKGDSFFAPLKYSAFLEAFGFLSATWRYVAYGIYRLFHGDIKNDAVHIDPIVVSSDARGMGIGTKLFEAAFELTKRLNRKKVILEVVDTNPKAKKLYERLGFQVVKEENTALLTKNAGFEKVFHMEKILN